MPSRLTLALEKDLLQLPDVGTIAALNASPLDDFGGLEVGRLKAQQNHFPDVEALNARGIETTPQITGSFAATLVRCHRAKAATHGLIAHAVEMTQTGGLIVVDGDKTNGVESIVKDLRKLVTLEDVYSKSHGKLLWFTKTDIPPDLSHWTAEPTKVADFVTYPGVFSADKIDKGSQLLAAHLPDLKGQIADLGAGWGYLSRKVLESDAVTTLDLIEADALALQAAKQNITDPRAEFLWADALNSPKKGYDAVISNPPFHTTRAADPALGQGFIHAAARMLKPSGSFWMVANRNLPYEDTLDAAFGNTQLVTQENGFKIFHARKPKMSRPR